VVTTFIVKFDIQKFCGMPTDCNHVFCADLRISSDGSHWFPGALTKFQKATLNFNMMDYINIGQWIVDLNIDMKLDLVVMICRLLL
jgi:hypothetical protein